ncbi:hypothetical protein HK405_012595, partial [Cladochytrium tenue]
MLAVYVAETGVRLPLRSFAPGDGSEDLVIFVFNRLILNPQSSQTLMARSVVEIEPLVPTEGTKLEVFERDYRRVQAAVQQMESRDAFDPYVRDAVNALDRLYDIHVNEYLPDVSDWDNTIREILSGIASSKLHLSHILASRLQSVSQLQSVIASVSPQLPNLTKTLSSHEQAFSQLLHVHRMPPAWAAFLVECVRRKEYVRVFLIKAREVAEVLAKFRRQEEKRRDNFKGEIVRYLPNKLVTGLDDKVPSWEIQVSNTKSNLPDISRVDLTDFERLVNNLRAAMNDVDPSASGLRGSQSSGGIPSNDSISKLQATLLKTLPQIDAIIPDFDRILIKAGLCERATKLEEENAKLKSMLSERSGIPVNSPNLGDRSVGQSPTLLKRQLSSGGKAFSLGTMDSRSTDVYEVARAEETIKAYENRIRTLESLLQKSYHQMSASRTSDTGTPSNIPKPGHRTSKPDLTEDIRAPLQAEIDRLTKQNEALEKQLASSEAEQTRVRTAMASLESRHNLVLADRDRERAVVDAERHQMKSKIAALDREAKESKATAFARESDARSLSAGSRNDQAGVAVGSFSSPPQPAGSTQLLASLRSDEKEIRKRLRELEDDVRCQTLQLVGLRDEVGLGVEGDDMFHEVADDDEEEGGDESEQDALFAGEADTSLGRSSVLAPQEAPPSGPDEAGMSSEEAVLSLRLNVEIDNLSRQLQEAKEEAEKHRVAHAEEVQALNTQLQEVTGGLTSEVASLRRTLEAAEATMAEHRDTAEQLKGKLRLTLEDRDSLERSHEAALSAAELRASAAAAQTSTLADRLDDWQLVCRLALEQVAQRHDALMRVAAAVSDAMADFAADFTFGDAARSFLADSTDGADSSTTTADGRYLGIPGDTVDPVSTAADAALLLPPLKAYSVERPSSSSSSTSDADGLSLAAPSDTDSAASPRSSAVLRPLPSTLTVAAAAADATDAVRDAYLAVVASAADDVDFSDWAARAVAAVDLIRSRLKETR